MKLHIGERDDITNFSVCKYIKINSCGVQENDGREYMLVREKGRLDFHILYISDGVCYAEHSGKEYFLTSGGFILYFPNEPQKYRFPKDCNTFTCWLHFAGTAIMEIFADLNLKSGVYTMQKNKTVSTIFNKIITFYSLGNTKYELQANACLLNLISVLSLNETEKYSTAYPDFIIDAVKYIHLHWQKTVSISDLAEISGLSKSRFTHIFKEYTGVSPLLYITNVKIEKAKEFLLNTDMSITDVSETVGYDDAFYFSRVFKKYTGKSPRNYRK